MYEGVALDESLKTLSEHYASIPIICGPTASGKSDLSLSLCQKIGGELCSCDSMQIYKHMNIGTAKPTDEEQKLVPHHLINIIEPTQSYNVSVYVSRARNTIEDCVSRGHLPVFCGGTGQYISALVDGISYTEFQIDPALHESLYLRYHNEGIADLYAELEAADPEIAKNIHPNNTKRVIRALEIYLQTGKTMTQVNEISKRSGPKYPFSLFSISWDRETLYKRMDQRVDKMVADGIFDEVAALRDAGLSQLNTSMQAIGYKEIIMYFEGKCSYIEAIDMIKLHTRHYGKRQLTWFRRMPQINYVQPGDIDSILEIIEKRA